MDHVCICLATFNGAEFLQKQLNSFTAQTHQNWSLLVSDDGSSDATKDIVAKFIKDNPERQILFIDGPGQGYVKNFLSLICHKQATGDFFAFADQDDIWLPEKLETALRHLNGLKDAGPKLYGGRTIIIDAGDRQLTLSPLFKKQPSFLNALVQNFSGGNTMVFNQAAKTVLQNNGPDVNVVAHDWWTYLVISGVGGQVIYDPVPQVMYRNHGLNMIGANQGAAAKALRIRAVFNGQFAAWNDMNVTELGKIAPMLLPKNKDIVDQFAQFRHHRGVRAIVQGRKIGLYRQTLAGTLSLYLASFFGKV